MLIVPTLLLVTNGSPAEAAPACTIVGTPGDDVLVGTRRGDVICGGGGDDELVGLGGDDVLRGDDGDDVLYGAAGDDLLIGRDGADELVGRDGGDRLVPGRGTDMVDGGADTDIVKYRDLAGGVNVFLEEGLAGGEDSGADNLTSIEGVVGTTGDDDLNGTADTDYLRGFGGDASCSPAVVRTTSTAVTGPIASTTRISTTA